MQALSRRYAQPFHEVRSLRAQRGENTGSEHEVRPGTLTEPQDLSRQPLRCTNGLFYGRLVRQASVEGD